MRKNKQQIKQKEERTFFQHLKTQRLNLKAPINDVKIHAVKTLTTQIVFVCYYKADVILYQWD